jgi:hypothetical protein
MINQNTNKRWSVFRRSTGRVVRSFDSREAARIYKRDNAGKLGLFDNERNVVVR